MVSSKADGKRGKKVKDCQSLPVIIQTEGSVSPGATHQAQLVERELSLDAYVVLWTSSSTRKHIHIKEETFLQF